MELKLSDNQLREVVKEAIFNTLPQEKRELLLKQAIQDLLQPTSASYNRSNKIQEIYEDAVRQSSREIIIEQLKGDTELRAKLTATVQAALSKVFTEKHEELASNFSEAICKAFRVNSNY